jgi:hypothetical protein
MDLSSTESLYSDFMSFLISELYSWVPVGGRGSMAMESFGYDCR